MKIDIWIYMIALSLEAAHQIPLHWIKIMLYCHLDIDCHRKMGVVACFLEKKSLCLRGQHKGHCSYHLC